MRKIVCRLRLNEVSRQWRRRPKLPPNASCSCISCSPTGCPPRGEVGRRPASGRSSRQGMSPPHGCGGRSHGSAARSRCWYGCGSNARWENRSRSAFPLYNFLGHSLLSPFRMVCANFILPESANYVFFFAFSFLRSLSVNCHFAKVSAHILYPKLRHPRLYQAEFSFVYEEFDLYRSLAIPVVGHLDSSLLLRIISNQNRSIIDMHLHAQAVPMSYLQFCLSASLLEKRHLFSSGSYP